MPEPVSLKFTSARKILAIAIPCILGWFFAYMAIDVFTDYGFGLFVWLPTVMGALTTMIIGFKNDAPRKRSRNLSYLVLLIFCLGLLTFAWEGLICLLMAAPMGFLFTYIGHRIGWLIISGKPKGNPPLMMLILAISVAAFMAFENKVKIQGHLRLVSTSIEINAPAETVWKNVIAFSKIGAPTEFIFKTGIAYPTSGQITGAGVGAIRHCNFSTGSFVEPITVWDEPRLLKFSVREQPEPLKEISPYDLHPNHLHGYWISKQGAFKLTQLQNGHTLLEGTTWYLNKIKPGMYWTLWSDYIVHKIHERVLGHIKTDCERNSKS